MKLLRLILLITLFVSAVCLPTGRVYSAIETDISNEDFFFGVTFGGNTTEEAKLLIDKVKGYTNLFVVDNWDVALNETLLTEICDLAVNANLNVIVYFSFIFVNFTFSIDLFEDAGVEPFHIPWLSTAWERWGDKFLGAYVLDEPGGSQIDVGHYSGETTGFRGRPHTTYENVTNYTDVAYEYVRQLGRYYIQRLNDPSRSGSIPNATGRIIPVFTADYALYWFDYLAGYDAVFVELGWDLNPTQNIALCRGAANVQEKDWGAIICWASNGPPYYSSGPEMLQDLNTAYYSGAKYLMVFNYPQINPYGALTEEHFTAMETFWDSIHSSPGNALEKVYGQVALVLPKDYGWGMRNEHDSIWGLYPPDDLTPLIGEKISNLLNWYGSKLDIIYDDPQFNYTQKYSKIYYWNSTIVFSNISCEVSSSSITIGNSITVSGSINPAILANVTLQISTDNGTTWNYLITLPSNSDGNYSYTWTPATIGSYELKASWEGEKAITEANSTNVLVTVTKIIPSTISYSVSSSVITEGNSVYISGFIDPAVPGKIVTFTLKRPDGLTLKRAVTTDINGFFYDLFKPHGLGYWNVTATLNEDFTYAEDFTPEQSFKLTNPLQELLDLPPSTILIIGNATAAITIIALIAWFITRSPTQISTTQFEVKAHLLGFGSGMLEFIDGTLRFHLEKGRFRKQTKIVREIPMSDIQGMNRVGNELSFTWKGVMDIFVIEETELAGTIFERIPQASREQRMMFEDKEATKRKRKEIVNMLSVAMETVDSLFDIIRSLYGRVDWNHIEGLLKCSQENAIHLKDQKNGLIVLDFAKLSLAVKERLPEEISKETYDLLRLLHDYFNRLARSNESLKQVHPNYHDAKTTIIAYYLLNDIILARIVGDKEIGREHNELAMMVDNLSKGTNLKINVAAIKLVIAKLDVEKDKEGIIKETRFVFKQQLKELITE